MTLNPRNLPLFLLSGAIVCRPKITALAFNTPGRHCAVLVAGVLRLFSRPCALFYFNNVGKIRLYRAGAHYLPISKNRPRQLLDFVSKSEDWESFDNAFNGADALDRSGRVMVTSSGFETTAPCGMHDYETRFSGQRTELRGDINVEHVMDDDSDSCRGGR
jgi:hypothetical protein